MVRDEEHHKYPIPESLRQRLVEQGKRIRARSASRRETAEFFSALQILDEEGQLQTLWRDFCQDLAFGIRLPDGTALPALFRLEGDSPETTQPQPSKAHGDIAQLMCAGGCHVLNLNFDPLLYLAMEDLRKDVGATGPEYNFIALHSAKEMAAYYASPDITFQPAVTNARGDVFFQRCTNARCPQATTDHALEAHRPLRDRHSLFVCPVCHLSTFRLQLSFPGYETKERLLQPIVAALYDFLAGSVSSIITIGVSGQWDPYLLNLLFKWSMSQSIPLIDVKPGSDSASLYFDRFRSRFFPGMGTDQTKQGACYVRHSMDADDFTPTLLKQIRGLFPSFLPVLNAQRRLV